MNADYVPGNVTYYNLHFASEETEAEHSYLNTIQSPKARKWWRWPLKPRTLILGAEQLQKGRLFQGLAFWANQQGKVTRWSWNVLWVLFNLRMALLTLKRLLTTWKKPKTQKTKKTKLKFHRRHTGSVNRGTVLRARHWWVNYEDQEVRFLSGKSSTDYLLIID